MGFHLPLSLLTHNTLEMLEHYARIDDVDVEQAHRKDNLTDTGCYKDAW